MSNNGRSGGTVLTLSLYRVFVDRPSMRRTPFSNDMAVMGCVTRKPVFVVCD